MKKVSLLTITLILWGCFLPVLTKAAAPLLIKELKCENLINPNAIDNTTPHFSWKNQSAGNRNIQQQYYEIEVASDSMLLLNGKADYWQSGKIKSSFSVMIPYNGKSLSSRSLCYWRVKVWDDKGKSTPWSDIARFGIGILNNEMQGSYIGISEEAGNIASPLLRKKFILRDKNTAFLHVNTLGYHEAYVNGQKVNPDVLSPAVSHLHKRSLIVTYDITPLLQEGENEILLWLAKGWYRNNTFNAVYNGPLVKAQLDMLQQGKWNTILTTDKTWTGRPGGYTETGTWQALQFGGERADGRLIPQSLETEALNSLEWYPVVEKSVPEHAVSPEMTEPNKIKETIPVQHIRQLDQSTWLLDMGKVLNGWFEIYLPHAKEGEEILMEYTDYLDKDGNFLDQGQHDIYIAAGNKKDVFRNKFHNHAFRYVKISNLSAAPEKKDINAYLIYTDFRKTSSFECSDPDLNAIHDMIQYTMQCLTYSGYMVDCPHLERAGYGGDGNSSAETLQTMYDVAPLYTNWIQAWHDTMREGGSIPHVAPNPGAGGGGPYWCGFIIMGPWQTYLNYNDDRLIQKYYPTMKEWLGYVEKYTVNGLLGRWPDLPYRDWFLGDWLAPIGVDAGSPLSVSLVNNCFISDCFSTMEKIATILGKTEEAREYAVRRENLNQLLHTTFYNPEQRTYATSSQLDMAYPMLVGVTPSSEYQKVKDKLVALTSERDKGHIGVGLVGVPILTK